MDLNDVTYSGLLAFLASTIEIAVAISIACLPFLRVLWRSSPANSTKGSSANNYHLGSGGFGSEYARPGSALHFCRGSRRHESEGFGHLRDDSSEIQLRPVAEGQIGQDTRISAGPNAVASDEEAGYKCPGKGGLVVKVETRWDVESSPAGVAKNN